MTTYTAVPDGDIDADSPVNVSLMTKIRDNPIAISEGSTGAPKIQTAAYATASVDQAAIGVDAVHQSELATGTEEESTSTLCSVGGSEAIFSSHDGFGFFPEMRTSTGTGEWTDLSEQTSRDYIARAIDASYNNIRFVLCHTTGASAVFMRMKYVSASPPYDLGDGPVGRFVYAEVDPGGKILRTWNADDPPWAGKIVKGKRRHDRETGKTYQWAPTVQFPGRWGDCVGDKAKMDAYIAALKTTEWGWVEITMDDKLAKINERPSPFEKQDPSNSVIIADPPSDIINRIQEMMRIDHDLSPSALLVDGYLTIDNTPLVRKSPPGVPAHGIKWK